MSDPETQIYKNPQTPQMSEKRRYLLHLKGLKSSLETISKGIVILSEAEGSLRRGLARLIGRDSSARFARSE